VALRGQPILDSLHARDPEALRDVVEQHGRRIYRAARGMGSSPPDADDLVQDVFVTFFATLERFEGRSHVGTWLFGILHHKAQERRRADAREVVTDALDPAFEARFHADGSWREPPIPADQLVAANQTADALRQCLAALSALHRDVFQLRQIEALSAAEVSRLLDCTVSHVGVMFHRARVQLRACLEAKGWRPSP
jgi:RNA polymerase sigma-70 factor (ECF subfamily)